jgi:hypothetical protein
MNTINKITENDIKNWKIDTDLNSSVQYVNPISSTRNKIYHSKGNYIAPWYDHYIRPFGKCHPDFDTYLIGDDPRGVKICVRREHPSDFTNANLRKKRDPKSPLPLQKQRPKAPIVYRFARNLYPGLNSPITYPPRLYNSHPFNPPNEDWNILKDYYKNNINYNGTGVYDYSTCPNIRQYAYQIM